MDFYTLSATFLPDKPVDAFASAIWTERYTEAGDVQIVTSATMENIDLLAEGTFLALMGSKEIMLLDTQSIEKNQLTVTGKTILKFLDERWIWFPNPTVGQDPIITDYTDATRSPAAFLADVVYKMVINPVAMTGTYLNANLDWVNDKIPGLVLGPVDTSAAAKRMAISPGPLYTGIQALAASELVGISLYLDSADPVTGFVLKFKTYLGEDHTIDGAYPLVRLSPNMDTLTDLKELRSIADWKNVAYVYYKNKITTHYEDPTAPVPEGMDRRILVVDAAGTPTTFTPGDSYVSPAEEAAFREQNARDALANHNYIHAVDGQTSPINEYQYGADYGLGDIIELEGITGSISKARVTEFIRSQDGTGEKQYPTISVIS